MSSRDCTNSGKIRLIGIERAVFLEIFPPLPLFEHLATPFGSPPFRAFNRNSSVRKWPRTRKRDSKRRGRDIRFVGKKRQVEQQQLARITVRVVTRESHLLATEGGQEIVDVGACSGGSFARTTQFRRKASLMARLVIARKVQFSIEKNNRVRVNDRSSC